MSVYNTNAVPYCFAGWNLFFLGCFALKKDKTTGKDKSHRVKFPEKAASWGIGGTKALIRTAAKFRTI